MGTNKLDPDTLPLTGTLTFMMTDLEGSTCLWETYPEKLREALASHRLIRDEFKAAWLHGSNLALDQIVEYAQIVPPSYGLGILNRMEIINEG